MELDVELVARKTDLGESRRLPRRTGEALVAARAAAAGRDDDARTVMREVGDESTVCVEHLRADGNVQHRVFAARTVRERAPTATARARAQLLVRPDAGEVAPARIRDEHDVAAVAAVAAVRAALRHELLAAKVHAPVATAAGDDE